MDQGNKVTMEQWNNGTVEQWKNEQFKNVTVTM